MEYLQVFDKDKNILNEKIERDNKYNLPENKYFMIVLIFIENSKGKFLLQKTSKERHSCIATTGGHVTFGDDGFTTVIKEVKEELGIDISDKEIIEFNSGCDGVDCYKMYYTKLDISMDEFVIQEEELSEVRWFSMEELEDMVDKKILNQNQIDFFIKCQNFINNK